MDRAWKDWLAGTVALFFILGTLSQALGQENGDAGLLGGRMETFLRGLEAKTRTNEELFTAFLADGRLRDRPQEIKKLVEAYGKLSLQYGPARSFEQVSMRSVGKDVYMFTYLAKTDTYPIAWHVTFYKTPASGEKGATWVVISLRFDTRLDDIKTK